MYITTYQKNIVYRSAFLIVLGVFFLSPRQVDASLLSIKAPAVVSVGERIAVDIILDPERVSINSVASQLEFSSEYLAFNGFSVTQSSIPVWVEEPKKVDDTIVFSGVIPGGLDRLYDPLNTNNTGIPVVRLFFISKKGGQTTLSFKDSSVLRNDGKGTPTIVGTTPRSITIKQEGGKAVSATLAQDTTPPQPFIISIINQSLFGRTPRLAVFSTEDADGGIDHYEIGVGSAPFVEATSPYPLPYRLFPYILTVRAFDYSGNMQEQQITVSTENRAFVRNSLLIAGVLLVGFLAIRFYNRRRS